MAIDAAAVFAAAVDEAEREEVEEEVDMVMKAQASYTQLADRTDSIATVSSLPYSSSSTCRCYC